MPDPARKNPRALFPYVTGRPLAVSRLASAVRCRQRPPCRPQGVGWLEAQAGIFLPGKQSCTVLSALLLRPAGGGGEPVRQQNTSAEKVGYLRPSQNESDGGFQVPGQPPRAEYPASPYQRAAEPGPDLSRPRRGARSRGILVAGSVTAVLGAAGLLLPAPYVVESPGPTFNTIGEAASQPLIKVEGRESYPTNGQLDLTTVYVSGGPNSDISVVQAIAAWADTEKAIYPSEFLYPPGTTNTEVDEENAAAMTSSQESAVAAALRQLDIGFTEELAVAAFVDGSPAEGRLEAGDVLVSVDGAPVTGIESLREALNQSNGEPVDLTVRRGGAEQTVPVAAEQADSGTYQLGIQLATDFSFPFDVTIGLDNVGGPSAGMMFALGIIDRLTPGELTGGEHFAGTGTIDAAGNVGPIGGIRQKMIGAAESGARFFLAPEANCGEVVDHVPNGLAVVSVATLDDAVSAVTALAGGADPAGLPQCTAD